MPKNGELTGACITDKNILTGIVMGTTNDGWQRGVRGWGSAPNSIFTKYQQHPPGQFPDDNLDTQVHEAAADMFLNWVYRKTSDSSSTLYTEVPGTWEGFRNIDGQGQNDPTYPGDARFEWMEKQMGAILCTHFNGPCE